MQINPKLDFLKIQGTNKHGLSKTEGKGLEGYNESH